MTTIAYRDGMLAADCFSYRGNTRVGRNKVKVFRLTNGDLFAAAGDSATIPRFRLWLDKGGDPVSVPPTGQNTTMIRVSATTGVVTTFEFDASEDLSSEIPYHAWGSGQDFAFGAMHAGATAEEAVRAAIAHDPWTGGDVMVLKLGQEAEE